MERPSGLPAPDGMLFDADGKLIARLRTATEGSAISGSAAGHRWSEAAVGSTAGLCGAWGGLFAGAAAVSAGDRRWWACG